jgi:hypothetical protein
MFDVRKIIEQNMPEIKKGILRELIMDRDFKQKFLDALGIKDDIILLNGDNIKIEVKKNE